MTLGLTMSSAPTRHVAAALSAVSENGSAACTARVHELALTTAAGDIHAFVSVPARLNPNARPLLAVHGISRDARAVFDAFRLSPKGAERVIIAPTFDEDTWPVFQRITRRARPDVALLEIIASLRSFGIIGKRGVDLFGFSGGAQLAHRFAMLYPQAISSLHLGAAGWYTMPQTGASYPYGLDAEGVKDATWPHRMSQGLSAFLNLPISIYVGDQDTATDEPSLRRNPALDAQQGADRRTRAAAYRDALLKAAAVHDISPSVRFHELPNCGHDFEQCAEVGDLANLVLS